MEKWDLEKPAKRLIESHLAAALIAGEDKLLECLPAESPPTKHLPAAMEALDAYCSGDLTALGAALVRIPIVSPYRDLRLFFKSQMEGDGSAIAGKIKPSSPFAVLFSALQDLPDQPLPFLQFLREEAEGTACLAAQFHGLSPAVFRFFRTTTIENMDYTKFVARVVRKLDQYEPQTIRRFCETAIVIDRKWFSRCRDAFGFNQKEALRFEARALEQHDLFGARKKWEEYLEALEGSISQDRLLKYRVRIYVHLARLFHKRLVLEEPDDWEDMDPWDDELDEGEDSFQKKAHLEALSLLEQAFRLKSDDPEIALELLNRLSDLTNTPESHHKAHRQRRRTLLRESYKCFPDHPEIQAKALDDAIEREAWKTVAKIAKTQLARDPINHALRLKLIEAHCAHGLKMVKAKKYDLAAKELDQSREYQRATVGKYMILLLDIVLSSRRGELEKAKADLNLAIDRCRNEPQTLFPFLVLFRNHGLKSRFKAQDEAILSAIRTSTPEPKAIMQLVDWMKRDHDPQVVPKILNLVSSPLSAFFSKAAKLAYSKAELAQLCELWEDLDAVKLMEQYAKEGETRFGAPLFTYYRFSGRAREFAKPLTNREVKALFAAYERAFEAGNDPAEAPLYRLIEELELAPRFMQETKNPAILEVMSAVDEFLEAMPFPEDMDLDSMDPEDAIAMLAQIMEAEGVDWDEP
ncbi:hypothetical protein [Sulfidibacter corallicola]|uniref:Tetratricopeptide repeat protein n=1 Tax=Sulfidibacter corallicola TaxID=2818388 RepID=A0A8A4TDN0_SULCO|nr:hypothetical protein [Sulfidibacter corallicola]QTD48199.1 hypothetical protein J3U87_21650 [Sulfidibacter corallicola]